MKPRNECSTVHYGTQAITFLLLVFMALVGVAAARGQQLLSDEQVEWARWHTNYSGTEVITRSGGPRPSIVSSHVVQRSNGHRMATVISPRQRAGFVQVDDGIYLWHYFSRRGAVAVAPSEAARRRSRGKRRSELMLTLAGSDNLAGHPVQIYTGSGGHPQKSSYRVWVDASTQVPLRTQWVLPDGTQVTEEFNQIDYGPQPAVKFLWPGGAVLEVRSWQDGSGKGPNNDIDIPLALPHSLPPGLQFDGIWLRELAGHQALFLHFHGKNGQASLFETTAAPRGSVPPGSPIQNWNLGPVNLTLVSDLPSENVELLRNSVRIVHLSAH